MKKLAILVALSSCACSAGTGQLNESQVVSDCAPEDQVCRAGAVFAPLAEGAEMVLTLRPELSGTAGPSFQLEPVDDEVLAVDRNKVRGMGPGVTAVLARTPDGVVLDFLHVWVEKADHLSIHRVVDDEIDPRDIEGTIQVLEDEELKFTFAAWSGTRELIGDPNEVWTIDGEGFAVLDSGVSSERRVVVTSDDATSASLVINALGLQRRLELEVIR